MTRNLALSVVIITYNEEDSILKCIEACPLGAEIVVLDSGSTDRTVELAKQAGALVITRSFDNYASQKNAAIAYATKEWILSLDADEVLSGDLKRSILEATSLPKQEVNAYRVKRSLVYMGKKLRFGKTTDYPIRLFQRNRALFVGDVHERLQVDGRVSKLKGDLLHYSYKNLDDYFNRFNRYTRLISENHRKQGKRIFLPLHFLRPIIEFFYRYILRLGFLDGSRGFSYALISSLYAFVKYEKLREIYLLEKQK